MKDSLTVQLVPIVGNEEMLSKVPHQEMEDLACVYRFAIANDEAGSATILVTNDLMVRYWIDAEQLHADAMISAPLMEPVTMRTMSEVVAEIVGPEMIEMMGGVPAGTPEIDLQSKLMEGKGGGYQRWSKVFNVKQTAKTIAFLKERNIGSYEELKQKVEASADRFTELGASIKEKERRLGEIRVLRGNIINYAKTKDVYEAYRRSGYNEAFYAAHAEEIALHKAAKEATSKINGRIPTAKELTVEFYEVLAQKKEIYTEYRKLKEEMRELQVVKRNMEVVLGIEAEKVKEQNKERM